MDNLRTLTGAVLGEVGERRQKRRFNLLIALFFAILAMTAIIAAPIVQSFVSKKVAAVAEWTDGLTPQAFGTETWAGTGTETDAFKIATATDLAQLACNVNAGTTYEGMYFTLTSELNLAGREWTPIGTLAHPFMGTFDGAQKAIYFMTMTGDKYDYYGLFGVVKESFITKVDMRNSYINVGGENVGGIIGYAENSNISCSTNGSEDIEKMGFPTNELTEVSMNSLSSLNTWFAQAQKRGTLDAIDETMIGGKKDEVENSNVGNYYNTSSVYSSSANVGGIAGYFRQVAGGEITLQSCWNTASVTTTRDNRDAGGIVGIAHSDVYERNNKKASHVTISVCANVGTVDGVSSGGGIVGYAKSEASNDVFGSDQNANVYIIESYAVGFVSSEDADAEGSILGKETRDDYRFTAYVHIGGAHGGANPYCYWFNTGCSSSYGKSGIDKNNASSTTSDSLISTSSKSGWSSGNWKAYDADSSTSGSTIAYKRRYISPNGASAWSIKSSSPYNYYSWSETRRSRTITLNKNGGSGGNSSVTAYEGEKPSSVSIPTKSGYTFTGYYKSTSGGTQYIDGNGDWNGYMSTSTPSTIYANWTAQEVTIEFYVDGSNIQTTYSKYQSTYGAGGWPSSSTVNRYVPSGYKWDGYFYDDYDTSGGVDMGSGTRCESNNTISKTSTTIYLYAGLDANTITIYADANGGSLSGWETKEINVGDSIDSLPSATRTGYTFAGWYTSSSGGSRVYTWTTFSSSKTIYAHWTAKTYTVKLDSQGGTGGSTSVTATYGSSMPSANAPSRTYYTFGGYYTGTNGSGTQYYTSSMKSNRSWNRTTSNTTLYAKWTAETIKINYNSQGGSLVGYTTVKYGSSLTSTNLPTTTRTGYNFAGWYKSADSSTKLSTSTKADETNLTIEGSAGSYSVMLYAKWAEKNPLITLSATDADGNSNTWSNIGDWTSSTSSKTATKKYTYNTTFGAMPEPSRIGYEFKGWYGSTSSTATEYTSTDKVTFDSNKTLYAQWKAIEYKLTIDPMGGVYSGETTVSGTINKTVSLGVISKTGYTFVEWKASGGGSATKDSSGNWTYKFGADNGKVTAVWSKNKYTLTFKLNDSAASWGNIDTSIFTKVGDNYSKSVTYDETIKQMPEPIKTGYNFEGWVESVTSPAVWTPNTIYTVADNKTLIAKFTANPYILTIEYGNDKKTQTKTGKIGDTYTLTTELTREGYTFGGWDISIGEDSWLSGNTFTFAASDATVTAIWNNNKYTVEYHSNGGNGTMASSTFKYDEHGALAANTFTRTGWQFVRWNTKADDSGASFIDKSDVWNLTSVNGGKIDLYAQWGPIQYNITFDANGGIIQPTTGFSGAIGGKFSIVTYNYEQVLSVLPDVKLIGYTFGGWYYENTFDTQVKTTDKAINNSTFYAKLTANSYTLTLDGLDGTLPSLSGWDISSDKHTATKIVTFDSAIGAMPDPTLWGHGFRGWFDGTTTSATQYVASSIYTFDDNKTFYAQYTTNNMSVFFDAAGGDVSESQRTIEYNHSIGTLPIPTRAGYNFDGWYYEGTDTKATANDMVTKPVTLVAHWNAKSFTLTFDSNGGDFASSGSTYSKTVYFGQTIGEFPPVTKVGAGLAGWFENANGTGTQYLPTSIVQFTASTTIYAHFEMDKYTVIFNSDGGTCSITSKDYYYDSTYGELPIPNKVGFKFLGWTKETTGTNYVKSTGKVTDSHTLHAQYQANTYYIAFDKNRSDVSGATMPQLTVKYGEGVKLTKNTYSTASAEFIGWNTDTYGKGESFSDEQVVYNLTEDDGKTVTLYAQWADNTYWVVIDTLNVVVGNQNGYSQYGSFALRKVFNHNEKISGFPTLTKRGYEPAGYKDENGNDITENTQVTSDLRLIPQWKAKAITYTFDANGGTFKDTGSGSKSDAVVVIRGEFGKQLGALPTVERTGYTFRYYAERDNVGYTIFDGTTITVDRDVYAIALWEAISYVVVFNAGAGVIDSGDGIVGGNSTFSTYVSYDSTYGNLPTATLRGNTFKGWWTEPNMGGTKIETTTVFKNTAPTTLYAGWETSKYTVTISANGGNFGSNTDVTRKITGDYGKSYDLPIPSCVGYTFNGYEKTPTTDDGVASDSTGKWVFTFGLGDATLSAKWTPNSYKITFNYVESDVTIVSGEMEAERTVVYGRTYGAFPVPQKEGKTFAGWTRDDGTTVNGTDTVKITGNITLYAQWTTDEYSLTINPNGGTYKNSTQNTTVRGKLNATTEVVEPTRTGYTFLGWTEAFVGKDGSTEYRGLSGTTYTFGEGNGSLTANWKEITYEIKFVGGADDVVGQMDNQIIGYGMSVALTKNKFTRAGYEFRNWLCAEKNTEYNDTEMVKDLVETAQVLTFTAQWDVKTYVLTIDPNGGIYASSNAGTKITREFGATFDIPVAELPTRRGYKFTGFRTNENLAGSVTNGYIYTFSSSDDTIVAEWEVCVIYVTLVIPKGATWKDSETKIKFGVTGGDNNGRIQATFGQTYKLIPVEGDIIYAGYVFKGFYTENNQYIEASSLVDFEDDIVLTAKYTEHPYSLTIDPNMGEFRNSSSSQSFEGIIGDEFTLETPIRKGYTFKGWEQSGRGTLAEDNSKFTFVDDNCKLTAKWTANTYTVKFDKNAEGVDGTMADLPCTYDIGGRLPENKFSRTGYNFNGWTLKKSGSVDVYADGAFISNLSDKNNDVVTLYAQWSVITYTITFNPNGGTITSPSISRDYGTEYGQFPDVTKEGYTFDGWFTELNGGSQVKSDDIVTGAITLFAHWTANTYTITFRAGDGRIAAGEDGYTGAIGASETTITVTFGEFYTGMPSAEHDSKLFVGWFVSEQADSTEIKKTTTVTFAGDQTLFAHWASDQYNVSLDANGGSVSVLTLRVNHGDPYGTLPEPTYVGYTFDGWFFEDTDERITATTPVSHKGDHTLRAHWTAQQFTVSFNYDGGEYVATEGYEGDGKTKVVTFDETFGVLPMAAKTGMKFLGWYDVDDKLIDESKLVKILENITVKAKYENIYYSLVIELNGGKYGDLEQVQSFTGVYGQTIDILAPTKTGYNFAKYENRLGIGSIEKDGDIYRFTFGADDSTLYAIWDAMDIRVTFHAQQGELFGSNTAISDDKKTGTREYKFGDKFNVVSEMPSARLDGYRFLGWFTEPDGGFQMTNEREITIPTNFDLYAQFEPFLYVLTIDPQGGVFNDSQHTYDFENKQVGDEIIFNTPTREGYRFVRFIMTGAGTLTAQDEQLSSYKFVFGAGNATLTAQWDNEKYIVTFDYNGADGGDTTATLEVTYDHLFQQRAGTILRAGLRLRVMTV